MDSYTFKVNDSVRIISTNESGIVTRTRILGNNLKGNLILKLENNEKKIVSVSDIELIIK